MTGKKFDEEKFILECNSQDWDNILVLDKENVNETIDNYLQNLNNLLEKHAPLKKLNKQERKFQQKPWITKGLQVSIKKKNSIFRKYIRCQNKILKKDLHLQYKNYRNLLSTLLKDSKETYFSSYFKDNIKDIKKTWKGIKSVISMKSKNSDIPSSIRNNGSTLQNLQLLQIYLMIFSILLHL